ncbi:MAG: phage tail protein [Acidobacteria bacterium]|nr:phage tail protein [Acidobacteriota bacterium]MBI3424461.1 phage tail protein [Acidobacteriota bacterium]
MEPYLGEIRMFSGNYAPKGWLFCHGQLLSINNNDGGALFSLLGTAYGGDGIRTFALPDLRGRAPVSQGQSVEGREFRLGDLGGAETVTLNRNEMPVHTHAPQMNANPGTSPTPANNVWAAAAVARYSDQQPGAALDYRALNPAGGSQPHDNMPPFQAVNFIIAVSGIYPELQ